ncbi:MAG: SIR2 family protein [Deltaproteobacteria bacterium]|nr:SIR2 family protein [Deltaproteobacteria bacterium]
MSVDLTLFSSPELKGVVQDMRDLLSQRRMAFLLGAGCSKKAGLPLMPQLTDEILGHEKIGEETKELLDKVRDLFSGAESATIEDYMSEIVDLLSIAERRTQRGATQSKVSVGDQKKDAAELQAALDEIKQAVSSAIGDKEVDVTTHQQFVRAIHGSLQAGKADRGVDYFVLNYDTLMEDALGLEQVAYFDGFTGAATGWWEPSTFRTDGKAARVFKIHGSIDWCLLEGDSLPRRIRSGIKTESAKNHVLIYPAATKYQETQRDPFAQMLSHMRQSLRPSERKEMVLAICGYSFGDSHIDLEIENALHQSEERLAIAAFVETDEPTGKLKEWLAHPAISEQIRVYANKGFFHGDKALKLDNDTPWWKFEIIARLLGGER